MHTKIIIRVAQTATVEELRMVVARRLSEELQPKWLRETATERSFIALLLHAEKNYKVVCLPA